MTNAKRLLGRVLTEKGAYDEAEALLRDALHRYRERFGEDYPLAVRTRFFLGDVLRARGAFDEAEPLLVGSYRQYLKTQGADSRATRTAAESLVKLYEASGRVREAARLRAVRS